MVSRIRKLGRQRTVLSQPGVTLRKVFRRTTVRNHVPGNLARYMFLKSVRAKNADPTEEFYKLAGAVYSPLNVRAEIEEDDTDDIDLFD